VSWQALSAASADESQDSTLSHVRALLLQGLSAGGFHLRRLDGSNSEDSHWVGVLAVLSADRRADGGLEKIVGRLSLEPSVTAARWRPETVIE
jgi:putative Mg2+ transporter-C (MgtC) family protein